MSPRRHPAPVSREIAEAIQAIVDRTRREQGLPPTITDPAVLARIATLLEPRG